MAGEKLRIAYFIDAWNPGAGTENQLQGTLQHLDPEQVEARLFTLREPIPEEHARDIPCPVECLHVRSLLSVGGFLKFIKLARRLRREKYDIVMIYFLDTNLFVTPACRLAGIKACVVNRRDMGYWYEPGILGRLNRVNRWTNYFLVNSHAVKKIVTKNEHFPADRIEVIYNGMWDHDRQDPQPLERKAIRVPDGVPLIGIVANLRPVKRIDRFIDMATAVHEKINEAHFVIAGRGELEGELKQQAERLGIGGQVHFLGLVPDVRRLLPLLDVGVLTSESEGFSNALIEYSSSGVPAVTFEVGGNPEIIHDGVNGFLAPDGDVERLAELVVKLLSDNELRQRQAEAGRKLTDDLFDPERIMVRTMDFYRTIATSGRNQATFA